MIDIDQIELDFKSGYKFSSKSNRWNVIPDLMAEVKRLRKRVKTEKNQKLWEKAEVKRLQKENKKQLDVLSTLDEMIRYGKDHVELMKAFEQGLDLPETWKEMIE